MPFIPHKWLAPSANTALLFERSRWNVQDMHSLSYWTCQFFQFSPSSSQFWSFSIPALSCATVVSVTGIIQVKVGMEHFLAELFWPPLHVCTCSQLCSSYKVKGWNEGSAGSVCTLLPSILLGYPGRTECWEEGEKKEKGRKRIHIYLICNFLRRLAGLIIRCTTNT